MIFRNVDGELIEISRFDFTNDKLFYQKIMNVKQSFSKLIEINKNKNDKNTTINYSNYSNYSISKLVMN